MVIKKVRLENFRGFVGVHEFELHSDHINVIIGANGAGKTSILDAISYPFIKIINEDYTRTDFRGMFNVDHKSNVSYAKTNTEVNFSLNINDQKLILGYFYDEENHNSKLEYFSKNIKFSNGQVFKKNIHNIDRNSLNEFSNWYLEHIIIQNNEKIKIAETSKKIESVLAYKHPSISLVNKAVRIFIKELTDNDFKNIVLDKSRYRDKLVLFIEKTNDEKIEFDQLSSGEKSVFTILFKIALDAYENNFGLENPLLAPGIVLIDEIELHLHPKWQTSILQALNKTFPNIQFIVTTHSPLVINHLKNENLILLDEEKPDINLAKEKLNKLKDLTDPNHSEALKLETLITIEEED